MYSSTNFGPETIHLLCNRSPASCYPARVMEPANPPASAETPGLQTRPEGDAAAAMRTCPNCSAQLEEQRCKLACRGCGYYLSCSDFY